MSGEQTYTMLEAPRDPWDKVLITVCMGCGAVVGDTTQHDRFHEKTRSIV